ncbi:glycosyltransferase family 4 protein [Georgenia yuyongxinii]|uniref:D-inositol 3-phosphate glycosyltransferase n=1 Tax=Georgenia yuyongxinii TaxID=2589797 RepID=A0A5B8C8X2_9MICO|nr:glycosyltransferase [Georgenia yuyongxinii]QDC25582.1 glycosyltransferase family 4 protein [Georgenia yuyongxinii]
MNPPDAATRPRLLVLASTFPGCDDDGTPAFVRDLAVEMAEVFDTLVLVPRVPGAPTREVVSGVRVLRFPYFPRRWEDLAVGAIIENLRARRSRWIQVPAFVLAEALAARRAVRRFRPDVVHAHWIVPQGLVATLVGQAVPRLVTTHGGDLYALDTSVLRRLKAWVAGRAGHITVVNEQMAETVRALAGDHLPVSVEPMGAALPPGTPREPATADGPCRLLFVGRLVEKKGVGVLLDALRAMAPGTVTLTIVGDGPLRAPLERQATGLPVTFAGQLGRTQVRAAYAAADVVVVPSVPAASGDQDGLPVVLLEAMSTGLPVIASNLPGLNEAVADGDSGLLVPPGDEDRLRQAIARLAGDPTVRGRLGEAAAERAREYSITAVGARYRDILLRLAGGGGR